MDKGLADHVKVLELSQSLAPVLVREAIHKFVEDLRNVGLPTPGSPAKADSSLSVGQSNIISQKILTNEICSNEPIECILAKIVLTYIKCSTILQKW